jgi:hypothetical protein
MGPESFSDVVGVVTNFERMNRISDAKGVELGATLEKFSTNIRSELQV